MSVNGGPVWDRYRPPGSDTNPSRIDIYGTYPRKSHAESLLRNSPYSANNVRGILRNKREYSPVNQTIPIYDAAPLNETLEDSLDTQPLKPQPLIRFPNVKKCLENCIRPAVAELFSVLMAVFVVTVAENQMFMFAIHRVFRIGIVSALEAAMFSTFFAMFSKQERIHINPVLSLTALFGGFITPIRLLISWLAQFVASIFGVFLYQMVSVDVSIQVPAVEATRITSDESAIFSAIYQIVLCQAFTSAILCLSFLMKFEAIESGKTANDPGLPFAVGTASFLSLLISSASWNPVRSLALLVVSSIHGQETFGGWPYHYVFWVGPAIGSLFASFFYRLLFADGDKLLPCCRRSGNDQLQDSIV